MVGEGITNITWTDTSLPDYLARLKGSLTSDLMPSVEVVLDQTSCIVDSTHSWTRLSSLDVFDQSNADNLNDIQNRHRYCIKKEGGKEGGGGRGRGGEGGEGGEGREGGGR